MIRNTYYEVNHRHQGLNTDGSLQVHHQDIIYAPKNYGMVTQIADASTTTILVSAGCSFVINGRFLSNSTARTVTRSRSTVSEKEYLYVFYDSTQQDGIGYVLSHSTPVYDTGNCYWIRDETGKTDQRWTGLSCPKDGSGNFYSFVFSGTAANAGYIDYTPETSTGIIILSGARAAAADVKVDLATYIYQPTVSNIVGHKMITYLYAEIGTEHVYQISWRDSTYANYLWVITHYGGPAGVFGVRQTKDFLKTELNYYYARYVNAVQESNEYYLGTYLKF